MAPVWALLIAACGQGEAPAAARYLEGAEIQAETDDQRAAIDRALVDMAALPADELRRRRYGPDRKTLPELVRAHIVPAGPVAVEDSEFYSQAADQRVKAAVEKLRSQIKREKQ